MVRGLGEQRGEGVEAHHVAGAQREPVDRQPGEVDGHGGGGRGDTPAAGSSLKKVDGATLGDLRLGPGTRLPLAAGDEVVLEPIAPAAGARVEPVRFTLAPLAAPLLNWQASVVEPARELAQALAATGRALQRLATGVALWLRRPGLGSA